MVEVVQAPRVEGLSLSMEARALVGVYRELRELRAGIEHVKSEFGRLFASGDSRLARAEEGFRVALELIDERMREVESKIARELLMQLVKQVLEG